MSTITLLKTYECAGGDHLKITVSGDVSGTIAFYAPDLGDLVTEEDKEIFLKILLKIGKKTRTKAQLKTLLSSGWTVTI